MYYIFSDTLHISAAMTNTYVSDIIRISQTTYVPTPYTYATRSDTLHKYYIFSDTLHISAAMTHTYHFDILRISSQCDTLQICYMFWHPTYILHIFWHPVHIRTHELHDTHISNGTPGKPLSIRHPTNMLHVLTPYTYTKYFLTPSTHPQPWHTHIILTSYVSHKLHIFWRPTHVQHIFWHPPHIRAHELHDTHISFWHPTYLTNYIPSNTLQNILHIFWHPPHIRSAQEHSQFETVFHNIILTSCWSRKLLLQSVAVSHEAHDKHISFWHPTDLTKYICFDTLHISNSTQGVASAYCSVL